MDIQNELVNHVRNYDFFKNRNLEEILYVNYIIESALSSLEMIELISFCEELFDVSFEQEDLDSEDFQSIAGLVKLVKNKSGA